MSFDRLIAKIIETKNPTVAGLDPKLDYIPVYIKEESYAKYGKNLEGAADALLTFNKALIDALCDIVPAIKPQAAYYEMYGFYGVKALYETISYAKEKGMFVITDGKRNDIGTTMEAYATAHLGKQMLRVLSLRLLVQTHLLLMVISEQTALSHCSRFVKILTREFSYLSKHLIHHQANFKTESLQTASLYMQLWAKCAKTGAQSLSVNMDIQQ